MDLMGCLKSLNIQLTSDLVVSHGCSGSPPSAEVSPSTDISSSERSRSVTLVSTDSSSAGSGSQPGGATAEDSG